jgi:hypothetical protein
MKQQTISTCFSTASSKLSPESGLSLYKAANYTSVSSKNTAESLSPEDVAKIQRNRVAATIRRFAHYLKEPQWKERLQPGRRNPPTPLVFSGVLLRVDGGD